MRDDERHFPPGVVPAFVGALGALAAIVLVLGLIFGALLGFCDRREPVQMIPPANYSGSLNGSTIATASAQVVATQSVRVTVRRPSGYNVQDKALQASPSGTLKPGGYSHARGPEQPVQLLKDSVLDFDSEEIVIEVSQAIAATSSAQSSASVAVNSPKILESSHGRLGVSLVTMPGILAADLQLVRLDVSPVTRWLVDVPMELGVDAAANTEAGALGVTAGSKAFVGVYYWSRWNLSQQGPALGIGLRF